MAFPIADQMYQTVCDIQPSDLSAHGITAVLLDLDSTLMSARGTEVPASVCRWISLLKQSGLQVMLLSNNRHETRVRTMCAVLDIPYIYLARKPFRRGFSKAAALLHAEPQEIAMIGDQIFTDILGANRFGAFSILVESLDMHLTYVKLRRIAEWPFVAYARKHKMVSRHG